MYTYISLYMAFILSKGDREQDYSREMLAMKEKNRQEYENINYQSHNMPEIRDERHKLKRACCY